jgi:ATP-binding cassette subfamily F protein 3
MTLVTLEKITRRFGEHPVLDGLSLRIDEGDRVGVIGDNGAGKTTMIRILAGVDEPDTGARNAKKDLCVAYGSQMPALPAGTTVLDFARAGTGKHVALARRMRALEARMAAGDALALAEYGRQQAAFEAGGGYDHDQKVERVLEGLGFGADGRAKDVAVLSGGEQSRLQLAVLMTSPADLLILDEPTNHLDLAGIAFVEDFVRRYPGAVVVVSHDRTFLDAVATSIVEVGDGVATRYKGNFAHYSQQRDLRLLTEARQYRNQREFVDKEMDYIRRNMAGRNSAQAKGRLKRLQRLALLDKPRGNRAALRLHLGEAKGLHGQTVLEAEGLGVDVAGRTLLDGAAFRIQFGEVAALLGRNGAGKTTLLRLCAGRGEPQRGSLRRSPTLRVGYFSQDVGDLPRQGSVLDALRELDRTVDEKQLRDHLALFLFCGDDVDKPVTELSGGEKQRLSLARLLRSQFDFLCLDEPTNHLDVAGTEGLEQALKEYPGTVLLVSHDRRLVEEVADRVLWLEDGGIRTFDGGLQQCLLRLQEDRDRRARAEAEERDRQARRAARRAPDQPTAGAQKALAPGRVRNPLLFQRLEERIMAIEERLQDLREQMMLPDNYASTTKMKALQAQEGELQRELDEAYAQWENWQ